MNNLIFYSSWSMVIHEGMQVEAYNSESSVSFRIIQHLCRLSTTSKVFSNLSDSLRNILNRWMALLLQVQMNWGRRLAAWQRTLLSSKFTCLKTFCRHSICCSKQIPCSTFFLQMGKTPEKWKIGKIQK